LPERRNVNSVNRLRRETAIARHAPSHSSESHARPGLLACTRDNSASRSAHTSGWDSDVIGTSRSVVFAL
jgi:hypothetical protein